MVSMKCPYCNADISDTAGRKEIVCEYCKCAFHAEERNADVNRHAITENQAEEEMPAEKLFNFSHIDYFGNEHCKKSAEEMCGWINAGDTVQTCLERLKDMACENGYDWAVDTLNTELFQKMKQRVGMYMSEDEHMLFYKDSGVFSLGKAGTLITDKCIYCVTKKKVERLPVRDIFSIHILPVIGSCIWYFNSNRGIEIDNITCSPISQGIMMALVCLMVREYRGEGYKIKVYNGV